MPDLIYRYEPDGKHRIAPPKDARAAVKRLEEGNRQFATMLLDPESGAKPHIIHFDAQGLGLPTPDGKPPVQRPFAAVLSCADARVPVEMVLGQACNDIFVVRVAGNVLGSECLGSLDYALTNMSESLRVALVLGHSNCGAVTAAVDAFLQPAKYLQFASSHPLRAIVDRIFVAVRSAHAALEAVYSQDIEEWKNYRPALVHVSVVLNAALQAASVQNEFQHLLSKKLSVVYGVYDLATREVKLPLETRDDVSIQFAAPPQDDVGFTALARLVAGSGRVREMLEK